MSIRPNPHDEEDHSSEEHNPNQSGEYGEAVAAFDEIIKRSEQFCDDFLELAIGHADRGEHAQAIAVYDMMIRLVPDEPMRYRARGCSYEAIGNRWQAIADLTGPSASTPTIRMLTPTLMKSAQALRVDQAGHSQRGNDSDEKSVLRRPAGLLQVRAHSPAA